MLQIINLCLLKAMHSLHVKVKYKIEYSLVPLLQIYEVVHKKLLLQSTIKVLCSNSDKSFMIDPVYRHTFGLP